MTTLQEWFVNKTKRPLINLGTSVFVIYFLFAFYAIKTHQENLYNSMRDIIVTSVTIGVQQNNRELIESALSRSVNDLGARSAYLCKNDEVIISNRIGVNHCSKVSSSSLWDNVFQFSIGGFSEYVIYFVVPKYHLIGASLWLLFAAPVFLIYCWFSTMGILKRFKADILMPLENNLLTDKPLHILEFQKLRDKIRTLSDNKEKEVFKEAVAESKKAFAHNVKSPLRNLKLIRSKFSQSMDNDDKYLFDSAINQITNMADKLNVKTTNIGDFKKNRNKLALVDLSETLQMCSKNKTHEWSSLGKSISLQIHSNAHDLVITTVDPNELKALFSNLFNNAQEAGATQIVCSITLSDSNILIDIADNGSGIAPSIQEIVFDEGVTHGKPNGTGFGLYHARKYLQSWFGDIHLMESGEQGTRFRLHLPRWKAPTIPIDEKDTIVIIEDKEVEIDRIKKSIALSKKKNPVVSFINPNSFFDWHRKLSENDKSIVLLADFDFGEDYTHGADVINDVNRHAKSALITDSHEDARIYNFSKILDVPLIPKSIIERVDLFN